MQNVLTEALVRVALSNGDKRALSLPEIFAACAADRIVSYPALRAHQEAAWHAFLVQIAVMGCEVLEHPEPPGDDPSAWLQVLRALTPLWPCDEPWHLVNPPHLPAFFQPPVSDAALEAFKGEPILTPDTLDILVTSKNHDLKAERISQAQPDDWLFALVSLQTQEGQMGSGNYGIARMNGGYGSRPFMGVAPLAGPGARVMRDARVLMDPSGAWDPPDIFAERSAIPFIPLAWVESWDGVSQLDLGDLHPLFVECCRRIRLNLDTDSQAISAQATGSKFARIASKNLNGVLGDPWAPVESGDQPKVFSITSEGFSYRKVTELLFSGGRRTYNKPYLARLRSSERGSEFAMEFAALARGQGKTEGFHKRTLVMPSTVSQYIEADTPTTAKLAWERVEQAGNAWGKALRPALMMLFLGGPEEPNWRDPAAARLADSWHHVFDARVDEEFFPALWSALEQDPDIAARAWAETLRDIARAAFADATNAAPQRTERRFIAEARAADLLENALRKALPVLRGQQEDADV